MIKYIEVAKGRTMHISYSLIPNAFIQVTQEKVGDLLRNIKSSKTRVSYF